MSDTKPQPEPSMEEILAIVRRIIADDESGAAPSFPGAAIVSSDVLELTEAIEADGSVRHLRPFGSAVGSAGESRTSPLPNGRIEPAPPKPAAAAEAGGRRENGEPSFGPSASGRTLEEIARELLRPMLQDWLEENLPGMVEQAVRSEVARVAEDAAAPRRAPRARSKAKPE
jgi:uncharacterized protein